MTYSTTNTMNLSRGVLKNNLDRDMSKSVVLKYVTSNTNWCFMYRGRVPIHESVAKGWKFRQLFQRRARFFCQRSRQQVVRALHFFLLVFRVCAHTQSRTLMHHLLNAGSTWTHRSHAMLGNILTWSRVSRVTCHSCLTHK